MFEIQFSKNKKEKSLKWDNPNIPIKLLKAFKAESEEWSGWAYVINCSNGTRIYRQYIS